MSTEPSQLDEVAALYRRAFQDFGASALWSSRPVPDPHERILPAGAVVWAAVGKSLGFTPEALIDQIRRLGRYTEADFRRVASDPAIDPAATMTRLRQVLDEADALWRGCLPRRRVYCFCTRER